MATAQLSGRERAILRAVAGGAAELSGGAQPDLFLDGRCCCDQAAARRLVRLGLVVTAVIALAGQRVPARVTPDGWALLGTSVPAASDHDPVAAH